MRSLILLPLLALSSLADIPLNKVVLDTQTPSKEFKVELPQASTPLVRAYLYQNGVAWTSDGTWTPLLRYGTNWFTSASWVQVSGTLSSNTAYADFQFSASDIPQAGDYLAGIMLTNSTSRILFGQGKLSVVKTPFTGAGGTITLQTEIDWDTFTSINAPWIAAPASASTNEVLTWDGASWIAQSIGAISGDNLGDHTATENLNLASYEITNAAAITLAGDRKTAWPQGTTNIASASVTGLLASADFNTFAGKASTSITNGLATEGFVTGQGYVTASVTNGLAPVGFVTGQGYVTQSVTNGLASVAYVEDQDFATVTVTTNITTGIITAGNYQTGANVTNTTASATNGIYSSVKTIWTASEDPTGWEEASKPTITFDNGSRTMTITAPFSYWISGVKYTAATNDTIVIPATHGSWFVYRNMTNAVIVSQSPWSIDNLQIATVFWNTNTSSAYVGSETHSFMPWQTHRLIHSTIGTRYGSGYALTVSGESNFTLGSGTIYDEDILHSHAQTNMCTVVWRTAANGSVNFTAAQTNIAKKVGGILAYDLNGTNTAAGVNNYVAYWIFAANPIAGQTHVVAVMGQREDTTIANARNNNTFESLVIPDMISKESKILYRVIYQRNGSAITYIEATDYRALSTAPSGTYTATDHNLLSGRSTLGAHPASAITCTTNAVATDVQTVIDAVVAGAFGGTGSGISVQDGWADVVGPANWFGWETGVGSTTNNAIVPVGKLYSGAPGIIYESWSWYSSETTLQDRYMYANIVIPQWATGWNSSTAMVVSVCGSSTNLTTGGYSTLVFSTSDYSAATYTTNSLAPLTANYENEYVILTNQLGAAFMDLSGVGFIQGGDGMQRRQFKVRADCFVANSNYVAFPSIRANFK